MVQAHAVGVSLDGTGCREWIYGRQGHRATGIAARFGDKRRARRSGRKAPNRQFEADVCEHRSYPAVALSLFSRDASDWLRQARITDRHCFTTNAGCCLAAKSEVKAQLLPEALMGGVHLEAPCQIIASIYASNSEPQTFQKAHGYGVGNARCKTFLSQRRGHQKGRWGPGG